ncbi:MAG: glycosyltransferase family 9 protein [Candidatus Cloacimonetes bacterium]|nr:glycosyltransferase family 9 protein [Candidatus Cloacimonadota bacterium]
MKKIFLIQHGAIGDVLMCTPAVRTLRKHFPEAEITFLVETKAFDAVRHNPNINKFIVPDLQMHFLKYFFFLLKFVFSHYDIVIDFQRNPRSALITFLTNAKKRISFTGKRRNYAYNIKIKSPDVQIYAVIKKLTLLQPLGINESKDFFLDFYITQKERNWANDLWEKMNFKKTDFIIAVSPVSVRSYRVWDAENFAKLCDHLIEKYKVKIIFTWGPGEYHFIESILLKMKNKPNTNYKITNIKQLKAIYEKSSLFIGNDNGPRHIAIISGIPTIGIFSHLYASHWTPPGIRKHIAIQPDKPGIKNVSLKKVVEVAENSIHNWNENYE